MTKLSKTAQWEKDHPDDEPCPKYAAQTWRRKRGLERDPAAEARQAKHEAAMARYDAAMAKKREYEAKHGPMRPQQGETQ